MSTHLKAIEAVTFGCIGFNPLAITHNETNPSPTPLKPHRARSRVGGRPIVENETNPSPTLLPNPAEGRAAQNRTRRNEPNQAPAPPRRPARKPEPNPRPLGELLVS
jgi:hypothetical protein